MGKQQEIKKLIDKSIGTKGSLNIPSFWMNKILKDVIDLSQENNEDKDDGGITIVDSVSKLDPNAELGSLASVVKKGSSKEVSFRDLYQPDASMFDPSSTPAPELLSSVLSVSVFAPKDSSIDIDLMSSCFYLVPRDSYMTGNTYVQVDVAPGDGVWAIVEINGDVYTYSEFTLAEYSSDTMSYIRNDDQVEALNAVLSNGMDWCYFGNLGGGFVITDEQFATIDLFVKAATGRPSEAHVYLKKDNWEKLYEKDLENIKNNITGKANKILINSYAEYNSVIPNTYTTCTFDSTSSASIYLYPVYDASIYNEYIMEIKCTATPSAVDFMDWNGNTISINWANDNIPIFEAGYTYIISIVNNFGVFAQFTNS